MSENGRQVSLMFSGGVDSTMTAMLLGEKYDRVHLLTFGNGYGHYKLDRTRKRAAELRRHLGPGRLVHTIESVKELFEAVMADLIGDFSRYRSGFIWCMGCKIAMHTRSIIYNLEHGVDQMADGSSGSTGEMVEQMLLSVYMIREMYDRYGITYSTPVYTIPREEEIRILKEKGFRMGLRIGDRFLGVQPKCHPGELYYLPFLLLNQPPKHDEELVARFIEEKREVAHRIIVEQCGQRKISLPASAEEEY